MKFLTFVLVLVFNFLVHADERVPGFVLQSSHAVVFQEKPLSLNMAFAKGSELFPGKGLLVELPDSVRGKVVDQMILSHRQNPRHDRSLVRNLSDHDATPGLTSVLFFDSEFESGHQWRYWLGPASGAWGSKFAEVRQDGVPEIELLYAFGHYGTSSIAGGRSMKPLKPTRIAIVNTGVDIVTLHRLHLQFLPVSPKAVTEHIFSKGTIFDTFETGRASRFGGGESKYGTYPAAWRLSAIGKDIPYTITDTIQATGKNISIQLPSQMQISALDIACGDARGWQNGRYIPGGAYLTVKWLRAGQVIQTLMINASVGAQSMLRAVPENIDQLTEAGDTLEVTSSGDTAHIMGLRLGVH